jgi:hypothetical protein
MRKFLAVAMLVVLPGCYHAVVTTGRPASTTVINKAFQPSFIAGLIAPKPIDVSKECPNGVAKFETIHQFPEALIGGITFGIFTPFSTIITCASSNRMGVLPAGATVLDLSAGATPATSQAAGEIAVQLSNTNNAPVYVKY